MHLIETQALAAGVKPSKPSILKEYFPMTVDKFITFQPFSKPSKSYDLWSDVLQILSSKLKENNINIVQLGAKDERPLPGCLHLQGQTSIAQANYIISKSLLHFGADSFCAHLAGINDIPCVILYSNNKIHNVRPYFGNQNKQILLDCYEENEKPIYCLEEPVKRINKIKPEIIANSIFNLLNINYKFELKTLERGPLYITHLLEFLPYKTANPNIFGSNSFIVRMDKHFNEAVLSEQLGICPCVIVTNKVINKDLISFYAKHKRINQLVYLIDENHNPDFIKFCQSLGINILLLSKKDETFLKSVKFDYCEIGIIHRRNPVDQEKFKNKQLYFKTNKLIVSNDKLYPSFAHVIKDEPLTENGINRVIDSPDFWEDWEHFYFFTV